MHRSQAFSPFLGIERKNLALGGDTKAMMDDIRERGQSKGSAENGIRGIGQKVGNQMRRERWFEIVRHWEAERWNRVM